MISRWKPAVILALTTVLAVVASAAAETNLLRNGSFEGGMLYWHNVSTNDYELVRDAKNGEFACRLKSGSLMSAPFVSERGQAFTVSFWAKGPGTVRVQMPPSAREEGQRAKRLWVREAEQSAKVGAEWERVAFTWNADVPASGFWPQPHYLVQISGDKGKPLTIDGVTVTRGSNAAPEYVPRRAVEVVAECPDLPGYRVNGNIFDRRATVNVLGHVSNPGAQKRDVIVRWQLFDYEGAVPVGEAVEKTITLNPGQTVSASAPLKLTASGMVLARVSATDGASIANRQSSIDSSDLPLTSLPYPKSATTPDYRERFGGSFAGGQGMLEKFQKIGFGWTRWFPETKWHNFQKKSGAEFVWHDDKFDLAARHGVAQHVVLYGWPAGLMDKEHSGQPLPLDMKWPAADPRWEDLSIETAWDKYVKAAVTHFKGRAVIFEIENEPEFDKWEKHFPEYARFTIRTARQIRATDPAAKIMVNNVYGIPSAVNAAFFKAGGLKHIDVVSWHDYHEGWLSDAVALRRMRQNIDEAGGRHVEIWFNEGWAFSNTAVDEPIACTRLTSAQSCNAIMDSVAELTANGQKKTILFHTGYETHGMSFWDYSGPGTMLWDWYGNPLPLVAAWNTIAHHIGVSEEAGFVRPPGANFCVFQDLRNGRGVMIAYADRESKGDVTVEMPDFGTEMVAEDLMGNRRNHLSLAPGFSPVKSADAPTAASAASSTGTKIFETVSGSPRPSTGLKPGANESDPALHPLVDRKLVLSKTGRPVILYAADKSISGKQFADALAPLDRKHAGFVATTAGGAKSWSLPPSWEGTTKGGSEGSVALANGKPIWKLEQLWPPDWKKPENYRAMIWTGTDWNVKEGGFGGQPGASLKDSTLNLATRAPHGTPQARRWCGLTFIAPESGTFALRGTAETRIWDGKNKTRLLMVKRTGVGILQLASVTIPHGGKTNLSELSFTLNAGDELTLLPEIEGAFSGGDCRLRDFAITVRQQQNAIP
jgi:hypothetical protein